MPLLESDAVIGATQGFYDSRARRVVVLKKKKILARLYGRRPSEPDSRVSSRVALFVFLPSPRRIHNDFQLCRARASSRAERTARSLRRVSFITARDACSMLIRTRGNNERAIRCPSGTSKLLVSVFIVAWQAVVRGTDETLSREIPTNPLG